MNQLLKIRFAFVCALMGLLLVGCSREGVKKRPPMAKVKGSVTYKGKPVSGAIVSFVQDGAPRAATGTTDDNGNYRLTTYDTNDGAVLGTHKVTVTKPTTGSLSKPMADLKPEDLLELTKLGKLPDGKSVKGEIPTKYADLKTTTLQYTIDAGENEKMIELED